MANRTLSKTIDLNQSPNKYITEINNGITVHPITMTNGSHYTQIDGNGFYIKQYVDGTNDISLGEYTGSTIQLNNGTQGLLINETGIKIQENNESIAQFGTVTQIGADDNAKIKITPTNLQILTSQKVQAFGVDTTAREEALETSIQLSDEELINTGTLYRYESITKSVTLGLNNHSEISNGQNVTLKFKGDFTYGFFQWYSPTIDIILTKGQNTASSNAIPITINSTTLGTYSYAYTASEDLFVFTLTMNETSGNLLCDHYVITQNALVPEITLNGDVYVNKKILANFIIEQSTISGNHGTWYYRKWSDGLVEAWYNMDTSVSVTFSSASNAYRGQFSLTIPDDLFTQTPIGGYANTSKQDSIMHCELRAVSNTQAEITVTKTASGNTTIVGFFYIMGY